MTGERSCNVRAAISTGGEYSEIPLRTLLRRAERKIQRDKKNRTAR